MVETTTTATGGGRPMSAIETFNAEMACEGRPYRVRWIGLACRLLHQKPYAPAEYYRLGCLAVADVCLTKGQARLSDAEIVAEARRRIDLHERATPAERERGVDWML